MNSAGYGASKYKAAFKVALNLFGISHQDIYGSEKFTDEEIKAILIDRIKRSMNEKFGENSNFLVTGCKIEIDNLEKLIELPF